MRHEPVMVNEVLESLHVQKGKYIDATFGAGGHSSQLINNGGEVLAFEQDPYMLEVANSDLLANPHLKLVNTNFINLKKTSLENGFNQVNGILFDLGISNIHFSDAERGFSFQFPEAPLDMRLETQTSTVKAADLLNSLSENSLSDLFSLSLKPWDANRLAKQVIRFREKKPFLTVGDFLKITKFLHTKPGKHPATNAFLALRIAVNSELVNIEIALPQAIGLLKSGGRLAVITFHSVEDGLVKKIFKGFEEQNLGKIITKKAIKPTDNEVNKNPKARSARLRVIERK